MDSVIIGKLGNQNPVIPVILPLVNKEAKELLDFLVDAVCSTKILIELVVQSSKSYFS